MKALVEALVMQCFLIVENGYFSLSLKKNCRISFLKRLTNIAKTAMKRLSKSIMDSLCVIPPLPLKKPKKNLAFLELGFSHIRFQQQTFPFITMDRCILAQKKEKT